MTLRFQTIDNPNATQVPGDGTALYGINNNGVLVGDFGLKPANNNEVGFYGTAGAFTTMPGTAVQAEGINDFGTIAGYIAVGFSVEGFIYSGGPSYTLLNDPNAVYGTRATCINDSGVVGGYYNDGNHISHGYLYSNGGYTELDVPGADATFVYGINNAGEVVGAFYLNGIEHGFLYDGSNFTQLDDPQGSLTIPYAINDSGQIVGFYASGTASHGFVYSGGVYTSIDDPNAVNFTRATGINDAGQIVGYYLDGAISDHGFVIAAPTVPKYDFNGDGHSDIVWRPAPSGSQPAVWEMNGSTVASIDGWSYQGQPVAPDSSWSFAGSCDFNSDGRADLLWRQASTGAVVTWLMVGGTITSSANVTYQGQAVAPDSSWSVLGTLDFVGNGKGGVLWHQSSTGEVVLWQVNGSTIMSSADVTYQGQSVRPDAAWSVVGNGDVNGDGNSDIIWRNSNTGEVTAWFMSGSTIDGSVDLNAGGGSVRPDASWFVAGVGDFNGDGKADLLWRNLNDNSLVEWLMNGSSIIGTGTPSVGSGAATPDSSWFVAEVGDFNGDGRSDILWRHNSDGVYGQTNEWLMNGTSIVSSSTPAFANGTQVTFPLTTQVLATPTDFA